MNENGQTAFRETALILARTLREASLDHFAFERPLSVCDLAKCRATCCHDGVILSREEAGVLGARSEGVIDCGDGRFRTKTVPAGGGQLAEDFPDHFSKTRCFFLDDQHRCLWQLQSMEEKKHPWYYKPISCWMHPLLLTENGERPELTLLSRARDHAGFTSHTPCGRVTGGAPKASESLKLELRMLEGISGRDFYGELNAPPGFTEAANETTSG